MKINKKLTSIIYSLFILIGILLYANYMKQFMSILDKVDSKWYAFVLLLPCSMFFYCIISDIENLVQKICCVIYILVTQAILFVEYFLEINALWYLTILLFLVLMVFAIAKYYNVAKIHIVDRKQLRRMAEIDKNFSALLTYNLYANNISLVGVLALLFWEINIFIASALICVLAMILTIIKYMYCKRFYVKKTILCYLELAYILYAVILCSIVPVVCGIYKNAFGNVVLYVVSLLVSYLIFERQQITDMIKKYFEKI